MNQFIVPNTNLKKKEAIDIPANNLKPTILKYKSDKIPNVTINYLFWVLLIKKQPIFIRKHSVIKYLYYG